jgi:hypothetical protein
MNRRERREHREKEIETLISQKHAPFGTTEHFRESYQKPEAHISVRKKSLSSLPSAL